MKTQRISALEMLKHPLPAVVKGVNGVYEIIKVTADDINVTCYRNGRQGGKIPALRKRFDGMFEVIVTESSPNHLLDTIGALHTRNKGLQKGHSTLTRRVQELEEELALTKQQLLSASGTAFAVAGGEVYINDALIRRHGITGCLDKNIVKKAADAADKVLANIMAKKPLSDPLDGIKACQGSRADFEALFKAPMEMAVAKGTLSDRAVDPIIADVMKPEITTADVGLQYDMERMRERHVEERKEWTAAVKNINDRVHQLEKLKPNPTAADHQLQHDINALTARVRALEEKNAGGLLQAGNAIHEVIDRMLQPGGLLYRSTK